MWSKVCATSARPNHEIITHQATTAHLTCRIVLSLSNRILRCSIGIPAERLLSLSCWHVSPRDGNGRTSGGYLKTYKTVSPTIDSQKPDLTGAVKHDKNIRPTPLRPPSVTSSRPYNACATAYDLTTRKCFLTLLLEWRHMTPAEVANVHGSRWQPADWLRHLNTRVFTGRQMNLDPRSTTAASADVYRWQHARWPSSEEYACAIAGLPGRIKISWDCLAGAHAYNKYLVLLVGAGCIT